MISEHRYNDFVADHLTYFTAATLRLTLELAGFEVLEVSRDWWLDDVVEFVQIRAPLDIGEAKDELARTVAQIRAFPNEFTRQGMPVAVWERVTRRSRSSRLRARSGFAYVVDSAPSSKACRHGHPPAGGRPDAHRRACSSGDPGRGSGLQRRGRADPAARDELLGHHRGASRRSGRHCRLDHRASGVSIHGLPSTDLDTAIGRVERLLLPLRGERIFVTGGTGFVGTWLVAFLIRAIRRRRMDLRVTLLTRDPVRFGRRRRTSSRMASWTPSRMSPRLRVPRVAMPPSSMAPGLPTTSRTQAAGPGGRDDRWGRASRA